MNKFNWVAQGAGGTICASVNKPIVVEQVCSWVYDTDEFAIVAMTRRRNPNWKESLIDLSKNDYVIKDGILMSTRKHAALIHAWADGAEIQFNDGDGEWEDTDRPNWDKDTEYRVKPKKTAVKCKLYHIKGVIGVWVQGHQGLPGDAELIDKDWREVEIEL